GPAYVQALYNCVLQADCLIVLSRRDWSDQELYWYFRKRCKTFRVKCSQVLATESGEGESVNPHNALNALQAELNRYRDRFVFEIPRVGPVLKPQPQPISEHIRDDVHSIGREIALNLDRFQQGQSESISDHLSSLAHRFAYATAFMHR